jgi:hypothetical protein
MKIRCLKCGEMWEVDGRIGFRDECPECAAYIHTCTHCGHYDAATRSCRLPNTEQVHDREGQNFCEEFAFGSGGSVHPSGPGRAAPGPAPADKPPSAEDARRKFDRLFRDPDP